MITFIFALLLAAVAILVVVLRKTYELVPVYELRRQAQADDELAKALYRVVTYGPSAQLLLWIIGLLSLAGSIVVMGQVVPGFLLYIYVILLIGYVLMWLPRADVTSFGLRCVVWSTPTIVWLISHLFVILEKPANTVQEHQAGSEHTGLYEREDILTLLQRQKEQQDNRLSEAEVGQLMQALTYSHKKVAEIMTTRKKVKTVSADEAIGPIVMGELHDSGTSFFPVHEADKPDHIVGTLHVSDVVRAKQGGHIRNVMRPEVYYVNEDYTVEQLLHAFLKTKQQVLIVINNFQEYVGIVTIEDTLRHVIGHEISGSFLQYDDPKAVASHVAAKVFSPAEDKPHVTVAHPSHPTKKVASTEPSPKESDSKGRHHMPDGESKKPTQPTTSKSSDKNHQTK